MCLNIQNAQRSLMCDDTKLCYMEEEHILRLKHNNKYINSKIEILLKAAYQKSLRQLWIFLCNFLFIVSFHFWRSATLLICRNVPTFRGI